MLLHHTSIVYGETCAEQLYQYISCAIMLIVLHCGRTPSLQAVYYEILNISHHCTVWSGQFCFLCIKCIHERIREVHVSTELKNF
jgi:hypothetical protein